MIIPDHVSLDELDLLLGHDDVTLELSKNSIERITKCRDYLDQKIADSPDLTIYGINTGFGDLCDIKVEEDELSDLQHNLIRSHACGIGESIDPAIVRRMMLLKVIGLQRGHSGVSLDVVQYLLHMVNDHALPTIYKYGSLGASGDLAPLAHMSLPLIGHGMLTQGGKQIAAIDYWRMKGLEPLKLKSKEGLALLNGTQFMTAFGTHNVSVARRLHQRATEIAGLSIVGYAAQLQPFHEKLQQVRPHTGQVEVAAQLRQLVGDSKRNPKQYSVQDPYSFRCIPQVHGATQDVLRTVASVFEQEINSVTDNPTVFPEDDLILSGGNFHGQTLAIHLDLLAIAMAELGSISERRSFTLLAGERELSKFLATDPGMESGLMIAQYAAAGLVSANKQLCTPASVDSITSSNGQEDHVSMGANAATQCHQVVQNVQNVLAIEWLHATLAVNQRVVELSPELQRMYSKAKTLVPSTPDPVWSETIASLSGELLS